MSGSVRGVDAVQVIGSDPDRLRSSGQEPGPQIWAIGGGKGGVGKSVIAANVAVRLGQCGRRVALVDADLGGANLHTILGVPNPPSTLSAFVSGRVADLGEVMAPTPYPGLALVSGARALLDMANPKYAQKAKILRHILALDVDHVILDLGAGSTYNVLDFFLAAHQGILVVVPEPTSVENAYQFLKSSFFRKLKRTEPRSRVREVVARAFKEADLATATSPRQLIERAERIDPEIGIALRAEAAGFAPAIVLNRVISTDQQRIGEDIGTACRDYFGTDINLLGCISSDLLVSQSIVQRRPAVELFPGCAFSHAIIELTGKLLDQQEAGHEH